jgi:hypothetical protein
MMLGVSSAHNDQNRNTIRGLVRPTPHVPWDVAVVGVVPSLVHEETIRTNQVAAYDSYGTLQALMSTDGKITLFQDGDLLQRLYHPSSTERNHCSPPYPEIRIPITYLD